ncbi:MAG: ATP-binding protein [Clostridiales Family XIII bacterium]|jgi:predicted AAA+ superfamily ATPase|nr:ATP-binding protein [Clostridiales Family XIII bacterium]
MKRIIEQRLLEWKEDTKRKPLILRGVRQCGKTWALKDFGARHYENTVYISFDENPEYCDFFAGPKDPSRILSNLSLYTKQPIHPGKTLLIFDEIQDCPNALGSLKYFHENHQGHHVACAGSLLGISIAGGSSFPVGKVDFLPVSPMTFTEFLMALGEDGMLEYIGDIDRIEPIPEPFFNLLHDRLKLYFVTGGMPEAVAEWIDRTDPGKLEQVIRNIITSYSIDFIKHLTPTMSRRVSRAWESLPSQLSKENKKFQYKLVKNGANARDYEEAIDWLTNVNLVHRVKRCTAPGLPISAYEDESSFKLYAADVGILRSLASLDPSVFGEGHRLFTEFKGALSENYVLQALSAAYDTPMHYWTKLKPAYEVDFILQHRNEIIPIEVKAGTDNKGKSIAFYGKTYAEKTPLRVRFSTMNLHIKDDLLNIPLFLADMTPQLIELAMQHRPDIGTHYCPAE